MKFLAGITATFFAVLIAVGANNVSRADEKGAIKKAKGGYTVEDLYASKGKLSGKKVSVRGKVIKFNAGIMGKNWVHLQDGSGKPGATNDITVTTNQNTKVDAMVVATGVLAVDKDFGAGYKYEVIIEDATLAAE